MPTLYEYDSMPRALVESELQAHPLTGAFLSLIHASNSNNSIHRFQREGVLVFH